MPGIIYRVFPRQKVIVSGAATIILAAGIDVSGYREGTLLLRNHTGGTWTAGSVTINAFREAPTTDEANTDFVEAGTPLGGTGLTLNNATVGLSSLLLSANMGGFIRITVVANSTAAGTLILSGDLSLKS